MEPIDVLNVGQKYSKVDLANLLNQPHLKSGRIYGVASCTNSNSYLLFVDLEKEGKEKRFQFDDFFKEEFDPAVDVNNNDGVPAWETLNPISGNRPSSVKRAEYTMPWESLAEPQWEISWTTGFYRSLTWALIHPAEAENQLTIDTNETLSGMKEAEQHGVEFEGEMPQSVTDWAAQTQEIVAVYEAETGSLPEIEQSLLTLPEFSTRV